MSRNNRGNKGRRSQPRRGRGGIQAVTSLSLSEAEERKLSIRSDLASFRGKQIFSVANLSGVSGASNISPSTLGLRIGTLLGMYLRWRILKLVIKPLVSSGTLYYGVTDDANDATSGLNPNEVLELRVSRAVTFFGTDTSELQWNPIDPAKWYYTTSEGAGGDIRLVSPCSIESLNSVAGTVSYLIYYTIQAEGAFDNTS
jgi:hypothetical protein